MDTVISNKYSSVLNELDIEVSKKLEGEYTVDEIISQFKNFFFNKMFLDITAIKDYKDLNNLQKLSMSINMDKVILLLDKDDQISDSKVFLPIMTTLPIVVCLNSFKSSLFSIIKELLFPIQWELLIATIIFIINIVRKPTHFSRGRNDLL